MATIEIEIEDEKIHQQFRTRSTEWVLRLHQTEGTRWSLRSKLLC
jgi:hypothetical protein